MLCGRSPERLAGGTEWPSPREAPARPIVMLSVSKHLLPQQLAAAAEDPSTTLGMTAWTVGR
jgi:hypothetical protein